MSRKKISFKYGAALAALVLLCLMCSRADARRQGRATDVTASPFSAAPYRAGERLTYSVSFSNFPTAAHVELLTTGRGQFHGREGFELRARVETIGVVSAALYALSNQYVTHVDPTTGLPYRAQQVIREGGRAEDVTRDFNTAAGTSAIPAREARPGQAGSFDFLSALFRLRALPLAPGAAYRIAVQNGDSLYDAEVRVTGRELLKTNVGSSNAIVTQVRVRSDKRADDYRVRIYFTDDERHVPVLLTARHAAGEIRAELASAEILNEAPPPAAAPTPTAPPVANATPIVGPPPAGPLRPEAELPFKPGEQLNFNFYLGTTPQPVGTATFQVRARANYFNRDGLLLTSVIQTTGPGQTLFPVNDQINSYVDAASVLPFRTELNLLEGQRRARWVVSSDQNGGSALFDDGTRVEVPVGTHDLLSVFYALRSFDLTPGKRSSVSLLINKRPRLLNILALNRTTVALGGQPIPAVELSLATSDPDGAGMELRLWVSTDRRRLPLRLTARTPLGPVRADLAIIPTALQ